MRMWGSLLYDREDVAQRARQAVQLPNHDDVILANLIEKPMQLWAIPTTVSFGLARPL